METVFLYFGKVIICSGVTFLYYQLSLKDRTFHHYNRFYLLSAILVSLFLPMIRTEDFTMEVNNSVYMLLDRIPDFNANKNINNDHTYFRIIFSALGLVTLCFLGRLFYGIIRIRQLKNKFHKENFNGIHFYRTDLPEAPFSYFKNLFWKEGILLDSEAGKQILKHEMVHIEQRHTYDKIFAEIITSVFWFNPFFHIIKKEISLIHEYLADKKAIQQSDTKAFAQMLLAGHFSGTQLPAASPFLSSNLKKRLKMLQKPKTRFGYARRIFALPVVFSVAFTYLVSCKNEEIKHLNASVEKNKKVSASVNNFDEKLASASENALFIINSERKTKEEFVNWLQSHDRNQIIAGYKGPEMNNDEHLVFGEIEKKYGVFTIDEPGKMGIENSEKYHQLIKEINPKWYNDQIVGKKYNVKKSAEARRVSKS